VGATVDVSLAVGSGVAVLGATLGAGSAVVMDGVGTEALVDGLTPGVGALFEGVPSGPELAPDGPGSGCELVGPVVTSFEVVSPPSLQLTENMQVNVASKAPAL